MDIKIEERLKQIQKYLQWSLEEQKKTNDLLIDISLKLTDIKVNTRSIF